MQKKFKLKCFSSLIDNFNVHYDSKFLDAHKADKYFKILEDKLQYNSDEESKVKIFGKEISIPRKQVAYGDPGTFYKFSGITVNAISWDNDDIVSKVLKNIKHRVELFTGQKFNFVLINRYADGDQRIGKHKDDEHSLGEEPNIVGVSLGAERDVRFTPSNFIPEKMSNDIQLELAHGSIYIMYHPTNKYWYHEIPSRKHIKTPRISLTFRYLHLNN